MDAGADLRTPRSVDRAFFAKLVDGDWISRKQNLDAASPIEVVIYLGILTLGALDFSGIQGSRSRILNDLLRRRTQLILCALYLIGFGGSRINCKRMKLSGSFP
jgi:hypothetical protein